MVTRYIDLRYTATDVSSWPGTTAARSMSRAIPLRACSRESPFPARRRAPQPLPKSYSTTSIPQVRLTVAESAARFAEGGLASHRCGSLSQTVRLAEGAARFARVRLPSLRVRAL
jgi:hypothetical protein